VVREGNQMAVLSLKISMEHLINSHLKFCCSKLKFIHTSSVIIIMKVHHVSVNMLGELTKQHIEKIVVVFSEHVWFLEWLSHSSSSSGYHDALRIADSM